MRYALAGGDVRQVLSRSGVPLLPLPSHPSSSPPSRHGAAPPNANRRQHLHSIVCAPIGRCKLRRRLWPGKVADQRCESRPMRARVPRGSVRAGMRGQKLRAGMRRKGVRCSLCWPPLRAGLPRARLREGLQRERLRSFVRMCSSGCNGQEQRCLYTNVRQRTLHECRPHVLRKRC